VHETKKEKKEKFDWSDLIGVVPVVITFGLLGGFLWEECGHHVYGTTPAQIEALSLQGSPKQVAKGLSSTDVDSTRVKARFKSSAGKPYEYVELRWSSKNANAPSGMRLVPEHTKDEDDEHGSEVAAALTKRFHALPKDGSWRWGAVEISARKHGELEASIDATPHGRTNPLFDRQMDAARQILLEAAFGIPVHASDADLAELLGTGYKTADVGKIDPRTLIEDVPALMASRFPGSVHDSSSEWDVAVDHPLLKAIELRWTNRRGGHLSDVRLDVTEAYPASRDALESCLANVLGAPQVHVTDYAASKQDYVFPIGSINLILGRQDIQLATTGGFEGDSLAKLFDAFSGCREKSENTGARGDGRKK
jgi:hypothetical protein